VQNLPMPSRGGLLSGAFPRITGQERKYLGNLEHFGSERSRLRRTWVPAMFHHTYAQQLRSTLLRQDDVISRRASWLGRPELLDRGHFPSSIKGD
jgi:hypothetical protein